MKATYLVTRSTLQWVNQTYQVTVDEDVDVESMAEDDWESLGDIVDSVDSQPFGGQTIDADWQDTSYTAERTA